jgi:hypothetical protein
MKRFALLRLENGGNKVIFDTVATDLFAAVEKFKKSVTNITLDKYGYGTVGTTSYCVAEYYEPFHTI